MPFKFTKLPYLAQKQVLKGMSYEEVFLFSLVSNKSEKLTKTIRWNAEHMGYITLQNNFVVRNTNTVIADVKVIPVTRMRYMKKFKIGEYKCSITKAKGRKDKSEGLLTINVTKHCYWRVAQHLYEHVRSIFGHSAEILSVSVKDYFENIGIVPKFQHVKYSLIGNPKKQEHIDAAKLDILSSIYPEQKCAIIVPVVNGEFKKDSLFPDINSLIFLKTGQLGSTILKRFKGKHLSLDKAILKNSDVISFLTKWVHNEQYQNLKFLSITLKEGDSFQDGMLDGFDTHPFDSTKKSEVYKYDFDLPFPSEPFSFEFKNFQNIYRQNDGKMASIRVTGNHFLFFVWEHDEGNI